MELEESQTYGNHQRRVGGGIDGTQWLNLKDESHEKGESKREAEFLEETAA